MMISNFNPPPPKKMMIIEHRIACSQFKFVRKSSSLTKYLRKLVLGITVQNQNQKNQKNQFETQIDLQSNLLKSTSCTCQTNKPLHVPVVPAPWYPARHLQVKLPGVFVQVAREVMSQLWAPVLHSSTSVKHQQSFVLLHSEKAYM